MKSASLARGRDPSGERERTSSACVTEHVSERGRRKHSTDTIREAQTALTFRRANLCRPRRAHAQKPRQSHSTQHKHTRESNARRPQHAPAARAVLYTYSESRRFFSSVVNKSHSLKPNIIRPDFSVQQVRPNDPSLPLPLRQRRVVHRAVQPKQRQYHYSQRQ